MELKYFNDTQITVYKAEGNQIDLNLDLLFDGQLQRFQKNMSVTSACGSSSCGSCTSDTCNTQ